MKLELLSISRLFFCLVDVYMLYRFFESMFPTRFEQKKCFLSIGIAALLILLINSAGDSRLNLLCIPPLYFFFVMIVFKIWIGTGIVYTIVFYAAFIGAKEVTFALLGKLLYRIYPSPIFTEWNTPTGIYFMAFTYLVSFSLLLLLIHFTKRINVSHEKSVAWYLLILPIASLLILSSFLYIDTPESLVLQSVMCSGAFLLYFSNTAVFIMLSKYAEMLNKLKQEELYTIKQKLEDNNFQNLYETNQKYREYMHDINSHLGSIRALAYDGACDEIVGLIDDLDGKIQERHGRNGFYSGNKILNELLLERRTNAEKLEVELSIFVEPFLNVEFLSDADIISLFGNILDNSLEAAARCEDGNKKVDIRLFMGNQYMLVLYVENSYKVKVIRDGERYLTTKDDPRSHGLGLGIVRKLAEKYGGNLTLEERDDIFITTLSLSVCKDMPRKCKIWK